MKNRLFLLLILVGIFSCKEEPKTGNNPDQTPEAFQNNQSESSIDYDLKSRKYDTNIINTLFDEAQEKDPNLKKLMQQISGLHSLEKDSLEKTNAYLNNNSVFWETVQAELMNLNDTILRDNLKQKFQTLEDNHLQSLKHLTSRKDSIQKRKSLLQDKEVLMKIYVALPMFEKYFKNENPTEKNLDFMIQKYDSLILKSGNYSK